MKPRQKDEIVKKEANPFWSFLMGVFYCFALLAVAGGMTYGLIYYIHEYRPNQQPIARGYQYKQIQKWMESDDAIHFWPTLKKSMQDGIVTKGEYNELKEIERTLDLQRESAAFLRFYKERKEYWEKDWFGPPEDFENPGNEQDAA